jgi:thiosulfate reductase cytochrome b subunit
VRPASPPRNPQTPRHAAFVRVTHWITAVAFLALLVTGAEIVLSHPRFYWGETGNSGVQPLFSLHLPSSRDTVPTGYSYVLLDQNGWSRYLHFEAAWVAVLTALVYFIAGVWSGHFRRNLLPERADWSWRALWAALAKNFRHANRDDGTSYNLLQRIAYLGVIFVLFPLVIWTGLALSPAFDSAFPWAVNVLGGRQSARTLHFFDSIFLFLFLLVHVAMVILSGFRSRMRAMITGRGTVPAVREEERELEHT